MSRVPGIRIVKLFTLPEEKKSMNTLVPRHALLSGLWLGCLATGDAIFIGPFEAGLKKGNYHGS
jgi:hypothetical protein